MNNEKIAIIGIGIIAPEAADKDQFWKNVVSGKNCISEVPLDRWDWRLYYSEDHKAADKTYSKIGGFIKNFTFDPIKYKIPPQTATQISRLQQITIEAVRMAFEDSGYDKKAFDPRMTAAVIGNAMGAMRKELTDLRVYKFYNEDLLKQTRTYSGLTLTQQKSLLEEYEGQIDRNILKITEDTMPGELANVTAGRIANVFNLNGPNMTMDAACASSLAALDYAVMGLRSGKFDMAVSGGADEMMSAPAFVKFCKIGALSADGSYSFDERANGFVMAEAVAVYLLKRYSDAVRDGDKIYALINSVGASSDGKGKGITAPNPRGQKMAVENAFAQVDYGPGEVDFVEAHGTATKVGDAAEVEALKEIFGPHIKNGRKLGLTSIKSQIGHAKAAAGAVSLVKTALALHHKTLPTSINCVKPNPAIDLNLFKVLTKAEPWETNGIRRANVSSFGFGGTNFHVAMEEYTGKNQPLTVRGLADSRTRSDSPAASRGSIVENPKAPFSALQGEAVTFTASTPQAVMAEAKALSGSVIGRWPEAYPMSLFAAAMNAKPQQQWGVSIVAKTPADLREKIEFLNANAKPETWDAPPLNFRLKGIYTFRRGKHDAKIGFLFPGQGSQYVDMMRDLAAKYEVVQATFDEADRILEKMIGVNLTGTLWSKPGESREELEKRENAIKQTQMTQPAMMTADMAMFRLLTSFGIKPDMVMGHSLGEYAAATAAGVFTLENGLRAVTSRAKEMSSVKVKDPGKMASIGWPSEKVAAELKKINGYVICANKNCPLQTVIAGERKAVEKAVELFVSLGVQAQEIAVSHAFHSAIIEPAIGPYRKFLESIPTEPWTIPLLSNVTAGYFPADKQGTYDLLLKQMTSPVEFIKQLERMYADGVRTFIECGPKRVLSAFAASTLKDKPGLTLLSSNHPKRGGITEFNDLLANLMALGFDLDWKGKHPEQDGGFFNPYYAAWAAQQGRTPAAGDPGDPAADNGSPAAGGAQRTAGLQPSALSFAEKYGFNFNPLAVSGIAGGAPGACDKLFREHNLDEILAGRNMIEPIPMDWREKQVDKNIVRVIKSPTGNHSIARIDSADQAIKLSARKGQFDLEKEFGVPGNIAKALDTTFKMAMAAGVLALKDAGLPLIHYYKKTSTGGYLPEKWALPEPLAGETGVIFASAFPVMESLITEITGYFNHKYRGRTSAQMWEVYDNIIGKLENPKDRTALRAWMEQHFDKNRAADEKDAYTFSQNFLMKVIPIADSQFAQWVGAKGPAMHISAACASTTQAVHTAECWLRAGKAKRVVIIAADDITNDILQEWTMPGFLASGTASTKENIAEAALPFDRRRDGLIVGSAAVGMVIEDETLVRARGMKPLARLLLTESANSAYHVSRLDTGHVAEVMAGFVKKIEDVYGLDKSQFAKKTFFMSHETYTPARGGSASAEVKALKKAFGASVQDVIISNVKGFTGHTMGSSLEEVVAIRALNTGIIPPIANYKEPDPELTGITLSQGGKYDLQYVLRFAAGFGSHMAMSFTERVFKEGENRIEDRTRHNDWLKAISGEEHPELEVTFNTLRIKDKKRTAEKPQGAGERAEGRVNNIPASTTGLTFPVGTAGAAVADPPLSAARHYTEPKAIPAPARSTALNEEAVKTEILAMIAEKTGYPKDMLELDLDMEADLGIDTVKQAELFAAMREHYSITRKDNLSLKDYPTIRHCVRFVLDETNGPAANAAVSQQSVTTSAATNKPQAASRTPITSQPPLIPDSPPVNSEPLQTTEPAKQEPVYPKRHIRYVPTIIPAPVENEIITKLSSKRPVVIFGEDLDLVKAFRSELNKHRIESFVFTSAKTKLKDTIQVDFKDLSSVEKAVAGFAAAHENVQGVFYLMGCVIKGLGAETNAFEDLKRYAMPLFLAGKYFNGGLNKLEEGHSTFLAVVTTLDGGFGYKTREVYDPVYGAIHGITLCLRKELSHSVVKLLDFEPHASSQTMVQKTFYEILYSDKRLAAGYSDNKRWTLIGKPELLEKDKERTPLKDKKVLITGGGRGLGGLFAKTIAARHKPHLIILDIIELNSDSARFAAMSEAELKAYKTGPLWEELKKRTDKATPAVLEREFTRIKDSAQLYRSIEELKALGVKVGYYRCDLNDKAVFSSVMNNIKTDLGAVDGVVHFAGLERSKLVVDKTLDEFFLIFNTKADSAVNMLKSGIVKEKGFWVMASSIAGKFGNLGQSDYAAASDYIAKLTISLANKGVRAFSVDMTAYANIGMGIRPGVEAFLKSQELDFLYPEEGMNALADELVYGKAPEIILSGSLGKLDWDKQLRFDPGFPDAGGSQFHFLERAAKNVKGLELEAAKEFSVEKDPYLADHAINGTPYVPGVMGIESFAEAAAAVSGESPRVLKDLHFTVPIKLLRGRPVDALVRANAARCGYDLRIESDFVNAKGVKLGSTKTHFSARYEPGPVKGGWEGLEKPELPKHPRYKITSEEIYKIYFHGPSFRVLDGILSIDKNSVLGVFKKPAAALWRVKTPALLFHPMVLEALFQTCGWRDIHFDRKMMLPDAVGAAIVYDNNPDPDRLYTYGVYKGTTEDGKTRYDAYAFDSELRPVAELKDYLMIPTQI
ncbi:MAG: SDR family NAD(P)-dependent oxidoreductase [Elusimicrobiales bacterium]|jgi:malonyl CoA-acyl carrier protein transacylase